VCVALLVLLVFMYVCVCVCIYGCSGVFCFWGGGGADPAGALPCVRCVVGVVGVWII
jgi:hypothetical protein